jgi:outer membrane protein assembly factor BamB
MEYRNSPTAKGPLVVAFNGRIFGIERHDGSIRWEHQLQSAAFPVVRFTIYEGRIYVGNHDRLWCIDYETGETHWNTRLRFTSVTGVLCDGHRVFVASSGELECVSLSGELLWENGFDGKGYGELALGIPEEVMHPPWGR